MNDKGNQERRELKKGKQDRIKERKNKRIKQRKQERS